MVWPRGSSSVTWSPTTGDGAAPRTSLRGLRGSGRHPAGSPRGPGAPAVMGQQPVRVGPGATARIRRCSGRGRGADAPSILFRESSRAVPERIGVPAASGHRLMAASTRSDKPGPAAIPAHRLGGRGWMGLSLECADYRRGFGGSRHARSIVIASEACGLPLPTPLLVRGVVLVRHGDQRGSRGDSVAGWISRKTAGFLRRSRFERVWFIPCWILLGVARMLVLCGALPRLARWLGGRPPSTKWPSTPTMPASP